MTTRQTFAAWILATIPQAAKALGVDLDKWVNGTIAGVEDRWFIQFQVQGGSQELANIILDYLDLNSIGYDDFSNEKQKQVQQYQTYVDKAQQAVDEDSQALQDLNNQLIQTADPTMKVILQVEINNQINTLKALNANLATWKDTLVKFEQSNGLTSSSPQPSGTSNLDLPKTPIPEA